MHTLCGTPIAFKHVPLFEDSPMRLSVPTCWVCGRDVPDQELA